MSPLVVTIAVRDTGCGMPEADVQKAFEPFFTTKAVGKGTGLGLFLSRETVLAHGGSLVLESEIWKRHNRDRDLTWIEERADAA